MSLLGRPYFFISSESTCKRFLTELIGIYTFSSNFMRWLISLFCLSSRNYSFCCCTSNFFTNYSCTCSIYIGTFFIVLVLLKSLVWETFSSSSSLRFDFFFGISGESSLSLKTLDVYEKTNLFSFLLVFFCSFIGDSVSTIVSFGSSMLAYCSSTGFDY